MDKELAQLHDLARDMLLEVQAQYEAGVIPEGFGKSDKKRLDKAISNLDFNPEAYGDIMETVMSGNLGPKELMKKIRNVETNVMKAFELLNEDTIHHLVQQRTGGDFSKQVSGDVVRGAIRRLEDRFGLKFSQATGPQGVIRGDTAQSNYAHKSDLTQKGAELKSGIGKNPDPSTTSHRFGTRGYAKTLTATETADEDALVKALEARIAPQLEDVKVGIATDQPRVQAIRKAAPGLERAYMPDNTAEEIAKMQKIARALPEEVKIQSYKQLIFDKGAVKLAAGARRAAGVLPFAGAIAGGLVAGGQAMAGDIEGAKVTAFETAAGEVPVVGDIFTADPAASGTLEGAQQAAMEVRRQEQQPKSVAAKILDDPLNELEYAGKQILGGLKAVGGAILFVF
jgi:hypothetical protein